MGNHRTFAMSQSVCETRGSVFVTPASLFVTSVSVFVTATLVFVMPASVFVTFGAGSAKGAPVREMSAPVSAAVALRSETVAAVHFREGLRTANPAPGRVTVVPGYATVAATPERGAPVGERVVSGSETRPWVPEMTAP